MFTSEDKDQLRLKGITEEQLNIQLTNFKNGFPYLKLSGAASVEKGILTPSQEQIQKCLDAWDTYGIRCRESYV